MKVCLIIVDCLRYDQVPMDLIPEGFSVFPCRALSDTTEPSLANILSGLPPEKHGILKVGQRDAPQKLRRLELIPRHFKKSFIASPATIFHEFFTIASLAKYSEEAVYEAQKHAGSVGFMMLHVMDVHDLRDMGSGAKFYQGFEPVAEEALSWKPPFGRRPFETDFRTGDAGLLKAKYKGAVRRVFKNLNPFILTFLTGWAVILTGDHGESFTFWHHDGVQDEEVFKVPLITNLEMESKEYNHLDIYSLVVH